MKGILGKIESSIGSVVVGKKNVVEKALLCILAQGHLLLEDVPGVGKTTLALAIAKSLGLEFQRLQFTSDLLPADILGASILNSERSAFRFHPGPIFHHLILADEINRASPRTQSALLEAMNEGQVTAEGATHALPRPFFVIATQNPQEHFGAYPLPESQRDRFLMCLRMGYPTLAEEKNILTQDSAGALQDLAAALTPTELQELIAQTPQVSVDESLDEYLLQIVRATRETPELSLGASPRAALALRKVAQAQAVLSERNYVVPDDIKQNAIAVLAHRLLLKSKAPQISEEQMLSQILSDILTRVPSPA